MADKSFGVKELNLLNASGTPTITSPNNLNLNANTVAISTSVTIGHNITVSANAGISSLNVSGIATVVNFNATGISTIAQPADSNPMANWTITNNSASAYRFTGPGQSGTEDNPNIYLVRGHRYIFRHNATSSHPIQIRFASGGSAYTDGVTYSEATNGGQTTDGNNLIFNVQHDAPAQLFYQCTSHGGMVGNIYIVGGPQVISGIVTVTASGGGNSHIALTNSSNTPKIEFKANSVADAGRIQLSESSGGGVMMFYTKTTGGTDTERVRIDTNGDLGLGIAAVPQDSGARTLHVHSTTTGGGARAAIRLTHGSSGSSASNGAFLGFDNNPDFYIYNQESGRLRFGVGGTEKLRINSSGKIATAYSTSQLSDYAQLDVVGNDGTGGVIRAFMDVNSTAVGYSCLELRHVGARPGQDAYGARFKNSGGGVCGSIFLGQSTAAFNTSSDYRLKENVVAISDGITRLKTLKPYRFNWIEEKGQPKVDGFFAHEVTAVPEAIKGTKDQVDENGNPEYQQIDQSKLVPLLTAALQEAITKIETLEAKVAALEGS